MPGTDDAQDLTGTVHVNTGGGGTDPAGQQGGGGDGGDDTENKSFSSEQLGQITGHVRESLGLKDGQDLSRMITGASKRFVQEALGLEKGQDAKTFFSGIVKDAMGAPGDKPPKKTDAQPPEWQAEFDRMKTDLNALQKAKEAAETQAKDERRKTAIRDALGKFDVLQSAQGLLVQNFFHGHEGPRPDFDEDGGFIVQDERGHPQAFDGYLKEYFSANRGLLSQQKFSGSGARSKGGAKQPATAFDASKATDRDGGGFDDAYRENSEKTLESLQEATAERRARVYGA